MKGMIFTEFMDLVSDTFGVETLDLVLRDSGNENTSYFSMGQYPPEEMLNLVSSLSQKTETAVPELLEVFGRYLFGRFAALYPDMVNKYGSLFSLLENIDDEIHVEVSKLFEDATPPKFSFVQTSETTADLIYSSPLHLNNLVIGLVEGAGIYFDQEISIAHEDEKDTETTASFRICRL